MKERPRRFRDWEVRAILDGRKTQMRQLWNGKQPKGCNGYWPCMVDGVPKMIVDGNRKKDKPLVCPLGTVGDRLWVRETWCNYPMAGNDGAAGLCYRATNNSVPQGYWKPSIHMPRWASRITLEITGVRVERLQDISPDDAIAEGCMPSLGSGLGTPENFREAARLVGGPYPRGIFAMLWNQEYAESWAANPWVWVVDFKRIDADIARKEQRKSRMVKIAEKKRATSTKQS